MIKIDSSKSRKFLDESRYEQIVSLSNKSFSEIRTKSGKGSEWLGWRDILSNPNDALLNEVSELGDTIRRDADVFIVCGIGGSYLGAKAVIDALGPFFGGKGPEIVYAGHHMSGRYLKELVKWLDQPKSDGKPKSVYLNVISKSGTTTETAIAFRILRDWMHNRYGGDAVKRIFCTTSAKGGALNRIIEANGYKKFVLPDDIGGRFSVLTPVGLLPIAVAGHDIRELYYGAVSEFERIEKSPESLIEYVSVRTAFHEMGYAVDVIASFEPELKSFGGWMQQLMGESEGKNHKGLYPTVHGYSTDLHSLGQMVQDGQRNMIETFLVVDDDTVRLGIELDKQNYDGLNYLSGKTLHEINTKAWLGTSEAHFEGGVPIINIHVDRINEAAIGALIYFFEIVTATYVYNLGENPFDQPGVEDYKKAMFKLLGKPE
ncbi:MAG TPA: glucose-6-phosphate isomerase [Bacteroidetes bacterium]|nr:glucose-6-phosphate isomerase [Bacteroidota bacterium]